MKYQTKEDKYLHERLEELDSIKSDTLKKVIRAAKRRVKREISKTRRNSDKQQTRRLLDGEPE